MPKQFTLGKTERLKSRKLTEALFSKGQRMNIFPYRIFYQFQKSEAMITKTKLQCGVGAGTRNFKKAVDRNRIKRLTREAWRLQKTILNEAMKNHPQSLSLFLIYTGKELPAFDFVKEKIATVIEKLLIIANENTAQDS